MSYATGHRPAFLHTTDGTPPPRGKSRARNTRMPSRIFGGKLREIFSFFHGILQGSPENLLGRRLDGPEQSGARLLFRYSKRQSRGDGDSFLHR